MNDTEEDLAEAEGRRVDVTLAEPKITGKLIEVDYEHGMVTFECCIKMSDTKKISIAEGE